MTGESIKDSGKRQEFETGSRRDTRDGKGRYDLLPVWAIDMLARHFEDGCNKYGDRNWEKGQPIGRFIDSALRHIMKYWAGHVDEMHLHSALWNLLAAVEIEARVFRGELPATLDDHPVKHRAPLLLRAIRHPAFSSNEDACWDWKAPSVNTGFRTVIPREAICESVHGPAPHGTVCVNTCGNPNCVNPRHLRWESFNED